MATKGFWHNVRRVGARVLRAPMAVVFAVFTTIYAGVVMIVTYVIVVASVLAGLLAWITFVPVVYAPRAYALFKGTIKLGPKSTRSDEPLRMKYGIRRLEVNEAWYLTGWAVAGATFLPVIILMVWTLLLGDVGAMVILPLLVVLLLLGSAGVITVGVTLLRGIAFDRALKAMKREVKRRRREQETPPDSGLAGSISL